jgi:hypothetical protein
MASGRVQLAAVGIQDNFTVNQPSFTYFQKVYKKHTKFALETIDNPFDGPQSFGSIVNCVVPRRGDLIHAIHLRLDLSNLYSPSFPTSNLGYTDSIGNAIVDWAELLIGGQIVQRITGEYMEMYTDLFISKSQQPAIKYLVGRTLSVNGLGKAPATSTYIVPLPFYFHRNDHLDIPMTAINKQEIEIRIQLKPLKNLVVFSDTGLPGPSDVRGSITKISLPIEYVFLSDEEAKYMAQRSLDYLITQVQLSRYTIPPGETVSKMLLQFINPVRELYFVIQNSDTRNDTFNYNKTGGGDQLVNIQLDFNSEMRISPDVATPPYLRILQPLQSHTKSPDRLFYVYSFALNPENPDPSGQVNMSRIITKLLTVTSASSNVQREIRVYAMSYNVLRVCGGLAGVIFNSTTY